MGYLGVKNDSWGSSRFADRTFALACLTPRGLRRASDRGKLRPYRGWRRRAEKVLQLGIATSDLALKSQSANTLIKSGGLWSATSTDGTGFLQALAHRGFSDFSSVLILGAGGTARAIAAALDGVADSITVLGRTSTREESFNEIVTESQFSYVMWSNAFSLEPFSLVVNTTPAGAADLLAEGIDGGITSLLFDVIYKPWPTVLAKKWSNAGAPVISGLELLLYQGIDQLRLVSAKDFDTEEVASTLRAKLSSAR